MAERLAHDQALVQAGLLHPDCVSRLYTADDDAPLRGVVLMLHGFTAGPWQFRDLSAVLNRHHLHAYAARLPGHGATAGASPRVGANPNQAMAFSSKELPKSHEVRKFALCADEALAAALELAQAQKVPLMVVGFSAGGALATDLLLRKPEHITRAVLIAPLLRPLGLTRRVFFRAIRHLPLGGRLIDRVPFAWRAAAPRPDGWVRPGHNNFHLGNVGALFAYAHGIAAQKATWRVPTQFVLTANDDKIDPYACRALAQRPPTPHAVWWFGPERRVPHAMLSAQENGDTESRTEALDVISHFLQHGTGRSNC